MEYTFDPSETIRGIQQLLVSDKKRIGFLFGAGTSLSKKGERSPAVPAITKMTERIVAELNGKDEWKSALESIREDIDESGKPFTVETLLSNVEEKLAVIGKGRLNGLDKAQLADLGRCVKDSVRDIVSVHKTITEGSYGQMVQCDFANWIKSAD